MTTVNEVVDFWLDEVGADRLYAADEALDHEVRRRFEQLWWDTLNGANGLWLTYASGTLAYLILMVGSLILFFGAILNKLLVEANPIFNIPNGNAFV